MSPADILTQVKKLDLIDRWKFVRAVMDTLPVDGPRWVVHMHPDWVEAACMAGSEKLQADAAKLEEASWASDPYDAIVASIKNVLTVEMRVQLLGSLIREIPLDNAADVLLEMPKEWVSKIKSEIV